MTILKVHVYLTTRHIFFCDGYLKSIVYLLVYDDDDDITKKVHWVCESFDEFRKQTTCKNAYIAYNVYKLIYTFLWYIQIFWRKAHFLQ